MGKRLGRWHWIGTQAPPDPSPNTWYKSAYVSRTAHPCTHAQRERERERDMWTVSPGMERAVALLFLLLGATGAQIPIQCATVGHMQSSKCCPAYPGDGSPCGSASGRGSCRQVETPRERGDRERQSGGTADFRQWWPTYFYTRACACQGNYGGADCGECTYGWRGDHCQEKHTVVRRDLAKMGQDERRKFVSAMQTAKTTLSQRYVIYASEGATAGSRKGFRRATVFDVATWIHYICSKTLVTGTGPNFAHQSTAFLTWHKLYLLYLEKEIRNVTGDEGFFIPVWIWAGSDNCTVCTDDLFGGSRPDGRLTGPFGNWTTYCTDDNGMESSMDVICAPGNGQPIRRYNQADPWFGSLPTVEDVRATLSLTTYDTPPYNTFSENSFRAVLEGYMDPQSPTESTASMHNLVHIYCGGTLNDVLQSSNDPVFPSIHAYVDMIFEWWLRNNVEATYPTDDAQIPYGHRADDRIVPFAELYRNRDMMKRAEEFGYNYEYF